MKLSIVCGAIFATVVLGTIESMGHADVGGGGVPVHITVIGCKSNPSIKPTLWLRPQYVWSRQDVQPEVIDPRGVFKFTIYLSPGAQAVRATTTKYCDTFTVVHLLAGHPRHVTLFLSGSILIGEDDHGLLGSLPDDGVRVGLVANGHVIRWAVIDSDAYYFDSLPKGNFDLRIVIAEGKSTDIPVSVGPGALTIRNIRPSDYLQSWCEKDPCLEVP